MKAGQYISHYDFPACDFYPGVYQLIPSHTHSFYNKRYYLEPIQVIPIQHKEKFHTGMSYWNLMDKRSI